MPQSKKREKNQRDLKAVIYPLVMLLLAVAAVILIIIMTEKSRSEMPAETTASPQASEALATPALMGTKTYANVPPMLIDTSKNYTATLTLAKGGSFVIELYADQAPITVNSFIFLARQGYFDGVTFHRVLEGFMAQAGDPTGTGRGGPGYQFEYEANDLTFDKAGVVAMANKGAGTATNGSQFFITFDAVPGLNGGYTIFGQVVSGMDVVSSITLRDPEDNPNYEGDVIESIIITED